MENLKLSIVLLCFAFHFGSSIRNKNEKKFEESDVQPFYNDLAEDKFMSHNPNIFGNFVFKAIFFYE